MVTMIMVLFSVAVFPPVVVQSFSLLPSYSGEVSILKLQRKRPNLLFVNRPDVATELSAETIDADDDDDGKNAGDDSTGPSAQRRHNKHNVETASTNIASKSKDDGYDGLGEYDPSEKLPERTRDVPNVGNPQLRVKEKERSVTDILQELAAIQRQGPQKYCILGTRHCSYLHQQIIELLAYALVLSGNHVYTSGAGGTHAATVRGALRAEREDLLTVVLPQSLTKQTKESQELLEKVDDLITMPQNDDLTLDVASRICNSYLLAKTDQLISFAFHESSTVIEASKEAKALDMLVTTLYLD